MIICLFLNRKPILLTNLWEARFLLFPMVHGLHSHLTCSASCSLSLLKPRAVCLFIRKCFESRLFFVDKLIEMGAQIILCDPHRATVIGLNRQQPLRGIEMVSARHSCRCCPAYCSPSAEGKSTIHNIEQIDRGYENIDLRLNKLGANIVRLK